MIAYTDLDWENPQYDQLEYFYYLDEMIFERLLKYNQKKLFNPSSSLFVNLPRFGADYTKSAIISRGWMRSRWQTAVMLALSYLKPDFDGLYKDQFDLMTLILKDQITNKIEDILALIGQPSIYMPFQFDTPEHIKWFIINTHKLLLLCKKFVIQYPSYNFIRLSNQQQLGGETALVNSWDACKTAFYAHGNSYIQNYNYKQFIVQSKRVYSGGSYIPGYKIMEDSEYTNNRMINIPHFTPGMVIHNVLVPTLDGTTDSFTDPAHIKNCFFSGLTKCPDFLITIDDGGYLIQNYAITDLDCFTPQLITDDMTTDKTCTNIFTWTDFFWTDLSAHLQYQ